MQKSKNIIASGAFLMALAVLLGAFGAHALKAHLSSEMLTIYQTGIQYHFYHALGLLIIGILQHLKPHKLFTVAAWLMLVGIVLFSGSLYALSITGVKVLGAITPLGGLSFVVAWVSTAIAARKSYS